MSVSAIAQDIDLPESVTELVEKVRAYLPSEPTTKIIDAYHYAEEMHKGQKRSSGEAYITHPLAVAHILADINMDLETVIAGLLHDVIEDTPATYDQVKKRFGKTVADRVQGVSKLEWPTELLERENEVARKRQEVTKIAENLRKMLLAISDDLRVLVIKLADRLHNMQTLESLRPDKQARIATETLQIYAPLAHRLGIWQIKWQLDNLAFKYLFPNEYKDLSEKVSRSRQERDREVDRLVVALKERLAEQGIKAEVRGRSKHLWSIFQKMRRENIEFEQIHDLMAVRVIVNTEGECYQALGIVHDLWVPIQELFYDYIGKPKPNGYRSLHTKVIVPTGQTMEVQIRTQEMHRVAEHGLAAHWQYKEGKEDAAAAAKMTKLRAQLSDWTDPRHSSEFMNSLLGDLYPDQVTVWTPRGDVIELPVGSTPIDYAYRIHTDLGAHCFGAKANGRMVPLNYQLRNGDVMEILTRPSAAPSMDWLKWVKTSSARSKIRAYFRRIRREGSVDRGRELVEREAERSGFARNLLQEHIETIATAMHFNTVEDLLASVGEGLASATNAITKLKALLPAKHEEAAIPTEVSRPRTVVSEGTHDVLTRRARCCLPLPGDDILGYITRGRGMVMHRSMCPNIRAYQDREPERVIALDWNTGGKSMFPVGIRIDTTDRIGLLGDVTTILAEMQCNIRAAKIRAHQNNTATIEIEIDARDSDHLAQAFQKLRTLGDVLNVYRQEPKPKKA